MLGIDTQAGVRILTLDRAERGNALGPELVAALSQAVAEASQDDGVHTLLLRGAGRNFCTGFDLEGLDQLSDGDLLARLVHVEELLAALWHAPLRTVALAQGRIWGAGADLFAACELRFAAADASFRFPGAGFGIVLGSRRLAERVGADTARRWVIDGVAIDAASALSAGLAGALVDAADALPRAALAPPAIARSTAAAIRAATREDRRDADLAALVRSAAAPGLRQRIEAYRQALRQAAGKPAGKSAG